MNTIFLLVSIVKMLSSTSQKLNYKAILYYCSCNIANYRTTHTLQLPGSRTTLMEHSGPATLYCGRTGEEQNRARFGR